MVWTIIIIIILFLVIRTIYRSTSDYRVFVKTTYDSFTINNGYIQMNRGSFRDCKLYVLNAKKIGTSHLGFKESYLIKRAN